MNRFEVEYHYYQYNSGAADNGYYTETSCCASAEEAIALAARINDAAKKHKEGGADEDRELHNDLIPYSGFFVWARAYSVRRTQLA